MFYSPSLPSLIFFLSDPGIPDPDEERTIWANNFQ